MITKAKADYQCKRCEYSWDRKIEGSPKPVSCPRCKSYKWDSPKTDKGKKQ